MSGHQQSAAARGAASPPRRGIGAIVRGGFSFCFGFAAAYALLRIEPLLAGEQAEALAIGAGLLGGWCSTVIVVLTGEVSRLRRSDAELSARNEALADRNWELEEAAHRASTVLDSQGDLIVLRDSEQRIRLANDAFCAMAGQPREALIGHRFAFNVLDHGADFIEATAPASMIRRSPPKMARAGFPGARAGYAPMPANRPSCNASAATSLIGSTPNGRSPKHAISPALLTAPNRGSWRWPRTKSVRRSTASSA